MYASSVTQGRARAVGRGTKLRDRHLCIAAPRRSSLRDAEWARPRTTARSDRPAAPLGGASKTLHFAHRPPPTTTGLTRAAPWSDARQAPAEANITADGSHCRPALRGPARQPLRWLCCDVGQTQFSAGGWARGAVVVPRRAGEPRYLTLAVRGRRCGLGSAATGWRQRAGRGVVRVARARCHHRRRRRRRRYRRRRRRCRSA